MNELDLARMLSGAVDDKEAVFRLAKVTGVNFDGAVHTATVDLYGQILTNIPLLDHVRPEGPDGLWIADMGKGRWLGVGNLSPVRVNKKNPILNGAMRFAQRATSAAGVTAQTAPGILDRWLHNMTSLGTWTISQEADAPAGTELTYSNKVLCTTADAAPAASDRFVIQQRMEGYELQRWCKGKTNAKAFTLTFWVKSNVTGRYIVWLYDVANNRSCSAAYNINASGVWEQKSVTLPADTTGTIADSNAEAFRVSFGVAAGSDFTGGSLLTPWATHASAGSLNGQVNVAAATNNYFQFTGVQLDAGFTGTPFELPSFDDDLAACQRYYEHTYAVGTARGSNTDVNISMGMTGDGTALTRIFPKDADFRVEKRVAPTAVTGWSQDGTAANVSLYNNAATKIAVSTYNATHLRKLSNFITLGANATAGIVYFFHWAVGAEF